MKTPWIRLIFAGLALIVIIAGMRYSLERLPPSKVNLVFKGLRNSGTNTIANFDLVNAGPRDIYWYENGAIIAELESGWVTNRIKHFTVLSLGTPPGSNEPVYVNIPKDAKRWRVRLDYSSFQRHNVRIESFRKYESSGAPNHIPTFMDESIYDLFKLIPMPTEENHEILSDVFTNRAYSEP